MNSECSLEKLDPQRRGEVPMAAICIDCHRHGAPEEEALFPRSSSITCSFDENNVSTPTFQGFKK